MSIKFIKNLHYCWNNSQILLKFAVSTTYSKFIIMNIARPLKSVYSFYLEGFKSMTVGKKLWAIIIIKVIILFAVLKLFFFPDLLKSNYDNDRDRADAVRSALTIE